MVGGNGKCGFWCEVDCKDFIESAIEVRIIGESLFEMSYLLGEYIIAGYVFLCSCSCEYWP